MKKNLFLRGGVAAILASALLASCSKDGDLTAEQPKPLEEDTSYFVNINILSADALTRAEDPTNFEIGTDKENEVNSIYLIFYDEEGNRVSTTQVRRDNADSSGKYDEEPVLKPDSRHSFYRGIIQIDVKHGSLPPAYVMAFVNPITSLNFDINPDFESLDALARTTRPRIMGEEGNFAMSKSVYYGKNRVSGEENVKIVATPLIDKTKSENSKKDGQKGYAQQLFGSKSEAESAMDPSKDDDKAVGYNPDESSVVNIYVERYAAKVTFKIAEGANQPIELNKDKEDPQLKKIKLTFTPEYWAVNAYESDTYIVKSFLKKDDEDGSVDFNHTLSFQELNEALGGVYGNDMPWFWNSEQYHRSYWAQSPAYYVNEYPRTTDDYKDIENEGKYVLGYYSYAEMQKNADKKLNAKARNLTDETDKAKPIYARENTVSGYALKQAYSNPEASPKAAIASVVLVGHYDVKDENDSPMNLGEKNFLYIRGNATNGYFVYDYDEMLKYFVSTTIHFAADANGDTPIFQYETEENVMGDFTNETYKKYFTIEHPDKAARFNGQKEGEDTYLVIDSRFVTIQLNRDAIKEAESSDDGGLYVYLEGKYQKVTSELIDKVNNQMLFAAGTVQGYNGGKVYYTIPIKHTGFYRDGNANYEKNGKNLSPNDREFEWDAVKSGDFGLVRNHSYRITVDKIEGLGNAIPDPNDPIVPPTDPEEYFIGARLIILNWAMVDEQIETL